jgi:hypothetical protein
MSKAKIARSWSQRALFVGALALVFMARVFDHSVAEAKEQRSEATSKAKRKSSKASSKKASSKKSKKSSTKDATASKRIKRGGGDNMPKGFRWPPSDEMKAAGQVCKDKLAELKVEFEDAPVQKKVPTPIVPASLEFAGVKLVSRFRKPPFVMDCHLALAFTQHLSKLYDLGVRELHFGSIYRYTKVRVGGKTKNSLSRHALGMAMDIYTIVDADGNEADVSKDYRRGNQLLHSVEDALNDSGGFRKVLSPKNDPISHDDHFHIEARAEYGLPGS